MQWSISLANSECWIFQILCTWYSSSLKTGNWGYFWSSRNERKSLSKEKCVLMKWCGVSQKQQMWGLSKLCHRVQHPWELTGRDYWSSRNTRKPHSKLKHVFRKCSGVSQKQWVLELSNICHCIQHPWKLTSRDFWSSRNERKSLSKEKCVLRKWCGVSQKWWMLEQYASHLCSGTGGSIGQSRFICQVLCTGIQGISVWYRGVHWLK